MRGSRWPRDSAAARCPALPLPQGDVLLLGIRAGEEAGRAQQLSAERADSVALAHPSSEARRHYRARLAPGAEDS